MKSIEQRLAEWENQRLEPEEEPDDFWITPPEPEDDYYEDTKYRDDYYEDCRNSFVVPRI